MTERYLDTRRWQKRLPNRRVPTLSMVQAERQVNNNPEGQYDGITWTQYEKIAPLEYELNLPKEETNVPQVLATFLEDELNTAPDLCDLHERWYDDLQAHHN